VEVQKGLANHGINEQLLANLRADLLPLAEHEITTAEHYKLIQGAAKKLTNTRTIITSVCKKLRDPAIAFQKGVIAQEKELLETVEVVEGPILARKKAWENIEQERMLEAARALATLHQNREKRLLEAEFRKDGQGVWRLRDWSLTQDEVTGLGVVDGELHDWIDDCERRHKSMLVKEQEEKDAAAAIVAKAQADADLLAQLLREKAEREEKEARQKLREERGVELNIAANGGPWGINRDLADLSQENFDRFKKEVFDAAQQLAPPPEPDEPPTFDEPPVEPTPDEPHPAGAQHPDVAQLRILRSAVASIQIPPMVVHARMEKRRQDWLFDIDANINARIDQGTQE